MKSTLATSDGDQVTGRLRVLVITSTLPATTDDGQPAFVMDVSEREAEAFDVMVLAPRTKRLQSGMRRLQVQRFPYFLRPFEGLADDAILPTLRSNRRRWIEVPFLLSAMAYWTVRSARRIRPDVVHAHWILPGGLAALVNHVINRTPYLVTVHGADIHALNGPLVTRLKRAILRRATAIAPVSASTRSAVLALDPALDFKTTQPIPMGVEDPDVTTDDRSKAVFLFVGRLAEKKGVDVALRAIAAAGPGVELRIIGAGPLEAEAWALAGELGIGHRVRFLGKLPRSEVFQEMASASALIIPSVRASDGDQEGTPVVLGEAMSLGTPVIASRIGGLEDYLTDGVTGFLYESGDAEALATLIRLCASDTDLARRVGEAARSGFAESPLNLEWTGKRYMELLKKVTAAN